MIYIVILPLDMDEIMTEASCNALYVWGGSIQNVPTQSLMLLSGTVSNIPDTLNN